MWSCSVLFCHVMCWLSLLIRLLTYDPLAIVLVEFMQGDRLITDTSQVITNVLDYVAEVS